MVTSPSLINEKQHFIKFSTAGYIPYLVNEKYEILFIKLFLHFLKKILQHLWLYPLPWRRGEVGRQRGWRWSLLLWFWWWGANIIIHYSSLLLSLSQLFQFSILNILLQHRNTTKDSCHIWFSLHWIIWSFWAQDHLLEQQRLKQKSRNLTKDTDTKCFWPSGEGGTCWDGKILLASPHRPCCCTAPPLSCLMIWYCCRAMSCQIERSQRSKCGTSCPSHHFQSGARTKG